MVNSPAAFVKAGAPSVPRVSLTSTTVAPGTRSSWSSWTAPVTLPVVIWAAAGRPPSINAHSTDAGRILPAYVMLLTSDGWRMGPATRKSPWRRLKNSETLRAGVPRQAMETACPAADVAYPGVRVFRNFQPAPRMLSGRQGSWSSPGATLTRSAELRHRRSGPPGVARRPRVGERRGAATVVRTVELR